MDHNMKLYLSKSLYVKGLQCHKALWLQKFQPELQDEISESQQATFDSGTGVGILARDLFPGGLLIPYDGLTHAEQLTMTRNAISKGVPTIYEATTSHDDVFIKADILHKIDDEWELYEVKSSTGMKEQYLNDIAVQYYVLAGIGLNLSKICLVHINTEYVRSGDIDPQKLFFILDVTEDIKAIQPRVVDNIQAMRTMLQADIPNVDIGKHCDEPYACSFKGHCWSHIPSPSVFDYRDKGKPNGFALYQQGIFKMADVPPAFLGWRQKLQLDGLLYQKNHVDINVVRKFIESLWYPLCFVDFETTLMFPIPMYDGTRPYQQVPFQYSVHVIHEPGGELKHHEFLADGATNPRKEFLERLLAIVPRNACVLVWNQGFEISRLKELAEVFPEKNNEIDHIINNIRDLMIPFRDKSIYNWQFDGSYSIKAVLPALVSELSYDNLDINDGGMASSAWVRMIQSNNDEEKSAIRKQLLQYCNLDTLAMVRILKEMEKLVNM